MIHFFRDVIDGPIYIAVVVICLFGIMAIFGFMAERLKKKEEKVALVKDVDSINNSKLVITSESLEHDLDNDHSLELLEKSSTDSSDILELNSNEILEEEVSSLEDSTVNKLSNDEEGILSINSADVVVSETILEEEESIEKEETKKITDMTQVIDFGSTDSVEEEVEKI